MKRADDKAPEGRTVHAGGPYEMAGELMQQTPLKADVARRVLKLIAAARKEPGIIVEQELELDDWEERAKAALPPTSFKQVWDDFQKWLLGLLPENRRLSKALLFLICIIISLLGLYEGVEKFRPKSEATPTPTPAENRPPRDTNVPPPPVVTAADVQGVTGEKVVEVELLKQPPCTMDSCESTVQVTLEDTARKRRKYVWVAHYERAADGWRIVHAGP